MKSKEEQKQKMKKLVYEFNKYFRKECVHGLIMFYDKFMELSGLEKSGLVHDLENWDDAAWVMSLVGPEVFTAAYTNEKDHLMKVVDGQLVPFDVKDYLINNSERIIYEILNDPFKYQDLYRFVVDPLCAALTDDSLSMTKPESFLQPVPRGNMVEMVDSFLGSFRFDDCDPDDECNTVPFQMSLSRKFATYVGREDLRLYDLLDDKESASFFVSKFGMKKVDECFSKSRFVMYDAEQNELKSVIAEDYFSRFGACMIACVIKDPIALGDWFCVSCGLEEVFGFEFKFGRLLN
jgi:hypothetical protein